MHLRAASALGAAVDALVTPFATSAAARRMMHMEMDAGLGDRIIGNACPVSF